jgi:hypothetical protein
VETNVNRKIIPSREIHNSSLFPELNVYSQIASSTHPENQTIQQSSCTRSRSETPLPTNTAPPRRIQKIRRAAA